jgi:hypothetical protein
MALTEFQRRICRLLAESRKKTGESYVAGGAALNEILRSPRISRDIDLFHDTEEALARTWVSDREIIEGEGLAVHTLRELPSYVEATVSSDTDTVLVQWTRDSAFRFFPLVENDELGLTLHPLDLATNKTLALVGRLEVRDWVDLLASTAGIQSLGYLAWAACGKDPGFSPTAVLEHAARSARYSADEVSALAFEGSPPDAGELSRRWRDELESAREIVAALPAAEVGKCVLAESRSLFRGRARELRKALDEDRVLFHPGRIRGAWPDVRA